MTQGITGTRYTKPYLTGTYFPSPAYAGQTFLHTPTGRKIVYEYDGANWQPVMSLGTMTIYVDGTNGTDDINYGTGSGSSAFKSISFAWTVIPPIFNGNVVVNVASGTYVSILNLYGKTPGGAYTITFVGALSQQLGSTTVTSFTLGAANVPSTITVTGASWGTNAYQNMLLVFDPGTVTAALRGTYYIVDSNTSNVLTMVGYLAGTPVAGDVFRIYTWATIQSCPSTVANSLIVDHAQQAVVFQYFEFSTTTVNVPFYAQNYASVTFNGCYLLNSLGGGYARCIQVYNYASANINYSYLSAVGGYTFWVQQFSLLGFTSSKGFGGYNSAGFAVGNIVEHSVIYYADSTIDGNAKAAYNGLYINAQSQLYIYTSNATYPKNLVRNCQTGIITVSISMTQYITYMGYSGNNTTITTGTYCVAA